jgi:ATP-dependent DNA ligase
MNIEQDAVEIMSADNNWVAEPKYDGQRLELWVIDGKVEFWGRHGKPLKYNDDPDPEIVAYLKKKFPKGVFLFDGELRHNKVKGMRHKLIIWDVFIFRNRLLNKEQYWTRRAILSERLEIGNFNKVSLIRQYTTDFKKVFEELIKEPEFEGIVMKNMHGKLDLSRTSGQNSNWMYKLRRPSGRYAF